MRTIDLSPLYRSVVGVDRMISMLDAATRADAGATYPPFNIEEIGEDAYRVELAVAGFSEDDLTIEVQGDLLTIQGRRDRADGERKYIHRGIAERAFERRFTLAEHVSVNGASLRDGLLVIDLVREVPEAQKPRTIAIRSSATTSQLLHGEVA